MSLSIEQAFTYKGHDWWRWRVWLHGQDAELDGVEKVVYTLHDSFPEPVRSIEDRASGFALEASGWGTFRIYARVVRKDGTEEKLYHDLVLLRDDESPAPP
jgi:transcription initiation factor IIF auxiliary subunit